MSCTWPVDVSCLPALPEESDPDYAAALEAQNNTVQVAISVLWALTGRQFSCKRRLVRPQPTRAGLCDDAPLIEAYYRNDFRGVPGVHDTPTVITLEGPVYELVEIRVDGEVFDDDNYVLEGNRLYRTDGKAWPRNNLSVPAGFPNTWTVEYLQGGPPPAFVGKFVGSLASEMIIACTDAKRCKLPRTVVSTTRSGVSHVFDPTRMLRAGFTGVPEIDTWIASVNPAGLATAARVR